MQTRSCSETTRSTHLENLHRQVLAFVAAGQPLSAYETARTLAREALAVELREQAADYLIENGIPEDDIATDTDYPVTVVEDGAWVPVLVWVSR